MEYLQLFLTGAQRKMSFLITNAIRGRILNRVNLKSTFRSVVALRYSQNADTDSVRSDATTPENTEKLGGFAKAYLKQTDAHLQKDEEPAKEQQTFAAMLRNSKFVDVRDTC